MDKYTIGVIIVLIFNITLLGLLGWVGYHFISKFW